MKNLLLLPALSFLLNFSLTAQWVSVNGPYGGNIWQLESNDEYVFAAKPSGLYRSTDAGLSWEKCSSTIYSILSLDNQSLLQLQYAYTLSKFRYSPDNGDHWQDVPLPSGITNPQNYSILDNAILFTYHDSLWRTDDFGQHWTGFQVSGETVHHYEYLENIGDRFYLGNRKRLLSSENGLDWALVSSNVPGAADEFISKIYLHDTLLFSFVAGTLARSANGGQSWQLTSGPFISSSPDFASINDTLFASSGIQLTRSTDKGLTWDFVNPDGPRVDLLSSFGDVLLGNIYYRGVSRSTDFGQSFLPANNKLDGGDVYALGLKENDLWLWDNEGISRQNTNQIDWNTPLVFLNQSDYGERHTIYHFQNAVFVREDFGEVYRTFDGGQNWANVTPTSLVPISHFFEFDHKNDTLYLQAEFGTIWQTTDFGDHWKIINTTVEPQIGDNIWDLTVQGSKVFVTGGNNIYRSDNNLLSWELVGDPMPFGGVAPWIRLFATPQHLFAWVDGERLFISNNQGENWSEASIPFSPGFHQLTEDRVDFAQIGDVILAFFKNAGVFISADNGIAWEDFNEGIPVPYTATDFAYNDSTMWLGTYDFGLFKRSITDLPTVSTTHPFFGKNKLEIFPNPTQGTFSCQLPAEVSGEATLSVFDLQGKQMLRRTESAEDLQNFDLSSCTKGVYWVSISTEKGVFGGKVLIQ